MKSIVNNEHKLIFKQSIEKYFYKNLLLIDDDFITKDRLGHKELRRLDLLNATTLKRSLLTLEIYRPRSSCRSYSRLRLRWILISWKRDLAMVGMRRLRFPFYCNTNLRLVQYMHVMPDDRRAYASHMQVANCL